MTGYHWQSVARTDLFKEFRPYGPMASKWIQELLSFSFSIIPTWGYPQKLRHRIHSQLLVAMPLQACRLMLGHWWSFWCCETATRAFLLQKLATSANSNLHPFRPPWMGLTLKSYFSWFGDGSFSINLTGIPYLRSPALPPWALPCGHVGPPPLELA